MMMIIIIIIIIITSIRRVEIFRLSNDYYIFTAECLSEKILKLFKTTFG